MRGAETDNTSGVVGVGRYRSYGEDRWRAYIKIYGRLKHLGVFKHKKDALAARKRAKKKYNYHVNHGQLPLSETRNV